MNSRRFIALTPNPRIIRSIAGHGRASQQKRLAHVRFGSMLLKKLLMRSVEPSDQLLRAFFRPALRPPFWPDWRV
jgi:hypothetical protein